MNAGLGAGRPPEASERRRVLVTGGGGLLGRLLVRELFQRGFVVEVVTSRSPSSLHHKLQELFTECGVRTHQLDLEEDIREHAAQRLRALLERGGFDLIVNLAADRGGVKYGKVQMKMNNSVLNTQLPEYLAAFAEELCVPVFLMSTEYVWSGTGNDPQGYPAVEIGQDSRFVGESGATPYALQKCEAERLAVRKRVHIKGGDSVTILRVPVLYGPILSKLEDGTACTSIDNFLGDNSWRHDTWQRRYPTSAEDVAFVLGALASKRLRPEGLQHSVYHYGAQESVSKFEFLQRFAEAADLPCDSLRQEDASQRPPGKRPPFDVLLDSSATREELTAVRDWREPQLLSAEMIRRIWIPFFEKEVAAKRQMIQEFPGNGPKQEEEITKASNGLRIPIGTSSMELGRIAQGARLHGVTAPQLPISSISSCGHRVACSLQAPMQLLPAVISSPTAAVAVPQGPCLPPPSPVSHVRKARGHVGWPAMEAASPRPGHAAPPVYSPLPMRQILPAPAPQQPRMLVFPGTAPPPFSLHQDPLWTRPPG